ncbi:MAG: type II toxin-antitoxin system HipA family toxin, partial [Peptostreptococcaceae bacterium]|nr:type II toxin-antitoxin system HipA family toxin [Peptostreptococcaceae bacterium]
MTKAAKVKLWGTIIGYFYLDDSKGYVSFEYAKSFLSSGIELSPIKMPLSDRVYEFPNLAKTSFKGVPGLMSDSLPDRFGNAVIDQWLASQGRSPDSLNVVERLCYTGKRGMGALEYEPDNNGQRDIDEEINMTRMSEFASAILKGKKDILLYAKSDVYYKQLLRLGTSAGGARAKAVIAYNEKTGEIRSGQVELGKDFDYWLAKFDGVSKNGDHNLEDIPEYTLIEYAYYKMALEAGITMSECRLLYEGGRNHFITKRFDRVDGDKLHMQSLGAIMHIDYNEPGLCSYENAALTARRLGLPSSDIEQFFRRMVFNVLAVNQDDHVKNISFIMNRRGIWSLSPAYDITFACNPENQWLKAHQMSINGKMANILKDDMITCGKRMDLKTSKCKKIIEEVYRTVERFDNIARSVGIKDNTINLIHSELEKRL